MLRWTKSDVRTQFKQVKTGQPQRGSNKEAKDSPPEEVGVVGGPGRTTDLPGWPTRPVGPTASTRACGISLLVPYIGCAGFIPWLPSINTRGVENRTHTHTHTHHTPLNSSLAFLAESLGLVEFRRSLGVIESPELLKSLV